MCTLCQPTEPYAPGCVYRDMPQIPATPQNAAATVQAAGPLPNADYSEIADYLVTGYWADRGEDQRAFRVQTGGTITVNYDRLTDPGEDLAEAALQAWADVTGLNFVVTSVSAADILFDDFDRFSAYASSTLSGTRILESFVNVGTRWEGGNSDIDSYTFMTYIHEIGHALGLGHAGDYNGFGNYPRDATFDADNWQATVMSYFSQSDNTTIDADYAFAITAMPSDIEAIRALYGTAGTTRTGDTTYWNNSNAGGVLDDVATYSEPVTMTIVDDGGVDTLDFGRERGNQQIHAYGGGVSNVGGLRGNLVIYYDTEIENVLGGSGNDTIYASDIVNSLWGNDGADTLWLEGGDDFGDGGDGNDTLYGGAGDDRLIGGAGRDRIFGGEGRDTAVFEGTVAVTVTLRSSAEQETGRGTDTIRQIENVQSGSGDDRLIGNAEANTLDAADGDDRLDGGRGNDTLLGGAGRDRLYGNDGRDQLEGGAGDDAVFGADGPDDLLGGDGDDLLQGGFGNDTIDGGAGRDIAVFKKPGANATVDLTISGPQDTGYGQDTLSSIEVLISGEGDDTLLGDDGDNNIQARGGNDRVEGRGGDDKLFGGDGADIILGGAGDDRIHGRAGNDTLTGDAGADIFVFELFDDADTVTDFDDTVDLLRIRGEGAVGFGDLAISALGDDTLIAFGTVSITLLGVDATLITASDFDFL
ncbi:MAG: M10 family metallopeptidase [Pseudomonadota bacterium]